MQNVTELRERENLIGLPKKNDFVVISHLEEPLCKRDSQRITNSRFRNWFPDRDELTPVEVDHEAKKERTSGFCLT